MSPAWRVCSWLPSSLELQKKRADDLSVSTFSTMPMSLRSDSSPGLLQEANFPTFPGSKRGVTEQLGSGELKGWGQGCEGFNSFPTQTIYQPASCCTYFPHCQGYLLQFLTLSAFCYVNRPGLLQAGSAFSVLQLSLSVSPLASEMQ